MQVLKKKRHKISVTNPGIRVIKNQTRYLTSIVNAQ